MLAANLIDLDELVLRCRDARTRTYVQEAVACLKAGVPRAAVIVTWVAVVHDLRAKIAELAQAGDPEALKQNETYQRFVNNPDSVNAVLAAERDVLTKVKPFELLGCIALEDLARLQRDRNRCAHPSMLDADNDYRPTHEVARSHLVHAVQHLFEHPPMQGKVALERLWSELARDYFPEDLAKLVAHFERGPLGRPRQSLLNNFVTLLLKHYLRVAADTTPDSPLHVATHHTCWESRVAQTLAAVMHMHRAHVESIVGEKLEGMLERTKDERLGALVVMIARVREVWHAVPEHQRNRLRHYVANTLPDADVLHVLLFAWNTELKADAETYMKTHDACWAKLASIPEPPSEWCMLAVNQLSAALNFDAALEPVRFLLKHTSLLSESAAELLLSAIENNVVLKKVKLLDDLILNLSDSPYIRLELKQALIERRRLEESLALRREYSSNT